MASSDQYILVINCGSSSLKFGVFDAPTLTLRYEGLANALGGKTASVAITNIQTQKSTERACHNHSDALSIILKQLNSELDLGSSLVGVGHRVVHGGELFKTSTIITPEVIDQIEGCVPLAPLHNPANIEGIALCEAAFPHALQVAVFDTAFHQSMPNTAYIYALPFELYEHHGIRRYGFHGSSHRYVAQQAESILGLPAKSGNFVTAHLGNGASVCAIRDGKSVDTSMGMTPLEGLVMGTRSGDIDPGIFDFLASKGYTPANISQVLNKESGLKGISKLSNDMRTLSEQAALGNTQCQLAIDIFCYRLAKYIASMMVALTKLDALVFTGGIGENADNVREETILHLTMLGFEISHERNRDRQFDTHKTISSAKSHPILVIRTDEEKMIASDTLKLITTASPGNTANE